MEIEKVKAQSLSDGTKYFGEGYFKDGDFIPHGFGKKKLPNCYAMGTFTHGILNGPAIISHGYQMNTVIMNNNRVNGWGMCVNSGTIIKFGYYKNSKCQEDLSHLVDWFWNDVLANSGRTHENMLHCYRNPKEILIGYPGNGKKGFLEPRFMGFSFMEDGSVYIGWSHTRKKTGDFLKFTPEGYIKCGHFIDGEIVEEFDLKLLAEFYNSHTKYKIDINKCYKK